MIQRVFMQIHIFINTTKGTGFLTVGYMNIGYRIYVIL